MVREACNPAAENAVWLNIAVACIGPFIQRAAIADLFQPCFRIDTEIFDASRKLPIAGAEIGEERFLLGGEVSAGHVVFTGQLIQVYYRISF